MTKSDIAVIVPAFNEAPVIPTLVKELREAFERHGLDGEVVLVDEAAAPQGHPSYDPTFSRIS